MTWRRESALATGLVLEALAVVAALDGMAALALAAHAASCGGIALGLGTRLPAGAATGLVFATAGFLPIVGALGWIVVASVSPGVSERPGPALVRTPIPGPEAARIRAGRPPLPAGSSPARARVATARRRDDPGAIALLRRSLADADEEVRLVAYAVLESKLQAAYRTLHDGARALEAVPTEHRARLHRRLAAEHWELARTGLAEGECLVDALERARRHARAAVANASGPASLALLLARIELRSGKVADAEAALTRAVELGLPPDVATPYLAEAAFLERRFEQLRQRLGAGATDGNAALERIRRFWS